MSSLKQSDESLEFVGCLLSVDCGKEGVFQGVVEQLDVGGKTITLRKPMKNGAPLRQDTITLDSRSMLDVNVIKMPTALSLTSDPNLIGKKAKPKNSCNTSEDISTWVNNAGKLRDITAEKEPKEKMPKQPPVKILQKLTDSKQSCSSSTSSAMFSIQNVPASVLRKKVTKIGMPKLLKEEQPSQSPVAEEEKKKENIPVSSTSDGDGGGGGVNSTIRYKEFGEFRQFEGQQVPAPRRFETSSSKRNTGPSGNPLLDYYNGYNRYDNSNVGFNDPIDFHIMQTDFDFDTNLALFEKHKLMSGAGDEEELIMKRNFRNDENVLSDPSRVTSWVHSLKLEEMFGKITIGIIGGTGLEDPQILVNAKDVPVDTPYGPPSDVLKVGNIYGVPCVLLSRHGRKHNVSPTDINYRANIWALKKLGVSVILASSASGSLKEEVEPGHIVFVDSIIDRTTKRAQTFYDGEKGHLHGICHIPAHPLFSAALRNILIACAEGLGLPYHMSGTTVCIEGPRYSTRAESELYRSWNATLVNMTICPESILAKELGLPYANVALVTDYDCWRDTHESVSVDLVLKTLKKNAENTKHLFIEAVKKIAESKETLQKEIGAAKTVAKTSVLNAGEKLKFDYI